MHLFSYKIRECLMWKKIFRIFQFGFLGDVLLNFISHLKGVRVTQARAVTVDCVILMVTISTVSVNMDIMAGHAKVCNM
jgi:hypothetical protein